MKTQTENIEVIPKLSTKEQSIKINELIESFKAGRAAFMRCGELIVELVDDDPYVYNYIEQKSPIMTPGILRIFEDIGRGKVLPSLAFDTTDAAKLMKRFPLPMQTHLETNKIPLVVRNEFGALDVRMAKLSDMTKDQRKQVIDGDRLRTEGQQRAILDEQASRAAVVEIKARAIESAYTIKAGVVTFAAGTVMTRKQLASILAQLS